MKMSALLKSRFDRWLTVLILALKCRLRKATGVVFYSRHPALSPCITRSNMKRQFKGKSKCAKKILCVLSVSFQVQLVQERQPLSEPSLMVYAERMEKEPHFSF